MQVPVNRPEAGDDDDVSGDERGAQGKTGGPLPDRREVEWQSESGQERGAVVVKHSEEKREAGSSESTGNQPEEKSGNEFVLGKERIDKAASPKNSNRPYSRNQKANERWQQSGRRIMVPRSGRVELARSKKQFPSYCTAAGFAGLVGDVTGATEPL